jgi:multidrug resistance efflux pump
MSTAQTTIASAPVALAPAPAPNPGSSPAPPPAAPSPPNQPVQSKPSAFGLFATAATLALCCVLGWLAWSYYVYTPWTRDGTVRAYTAQVAPEVAGRVTAVHVADNQSVKKGDVLFTVDDRDYRIGVQLAEAALAKAQAQLKEATEQLARRRKLTDLAITTEEREIYQANADSAQATAQAAAADLDKAKLALSRTEVRSPVNGYVTNLLLQAGTFANAGQAAMTLVDADSFWVTGYFEETQVKRIALGDPVSVVLMSYPDHPIAGHVQSLGRGITDPNAAPGVAGLPAVNPVFTWVRLAQRIPVRIAITQWPEGLQIAAGMTASVNVRPGASRVALNGAAGPAALDGAATTQRPAP